MKFLTQKFWSVPAGHDKTYSLIYQFISNFRVLCYFYGRPRLESMSFFYFTEYPIRHRQQMEVSRHLLCLHGQRIRNPVFRCPPPDREGNAEISP